MSCRNSVGSMGHILHIIHYTLFRSGAIIFIHDLILNIVQYFSLRLITGADLSSMPNARVPSSGENAKSRAFDFGLFQKCAQLRERGLILSGKADDYARPYTYPSISLRSFRSGFEFSARRNAGSSSGGCRRYVLYRDIRYQDLVGS